MVSGRGTLEAVSPTQRADPSGDLQLRMELVPTTKHFHPLPCCLQKGTKWENKLSKRQTLNCTGFLLSLDSLGQKLIHKKCSAWLSSTLTCTHGPEAFRAFTPEIYKKPFPAHSCCLAACTQGPLHLYVVVDV